MGLVTPLFIVSLLAAAAPAVAPYNVPSPGTQPARAASPASHPTTQRGMVLMDERFFVLAADEVNQHLLRGMQSLQQKDGRAAAEELRIAARYFELFLRSAGGNELQREMEFSRNELVNLSTSVANGRLTADRLNEPYGRAHLALARFHAGRLRELRDDDRHVQAGYELQAAARHLEQSLLWSQQPASRQTRQTIQRAQLAARALINGEVHIVNERPIIESMETLLSAQNATTRVTSKPTTHP
jgi:hypothetical protein